MKKVKWLRIFLISLIFVGFPLAALGRVDNEEVLKRLDELTATIENQQKEIESLKKALREQQQLATRAEADQKQETPSAVKPDTQKQAGSWRDQLPEWTRKIRLSGDLRLRYERLWDRGMLNPDGTLGKQEDRDRGRIRLRLYLDSDITDEISAHVMITTNMSSHQEATTTNATFGEDFNDKGIYLGRAYAEYAPNWLKGLRLGAGKFKKNFVQTDIMWDVDVNPDGVYEIYRYAGSEVFQPFVYLGQMVLNENNRTPDAMLYLQQAGFEWLAGPVKWLMAGSYYSWSNLNGSKWISSGDYNNGGGNSFVTDPATGDIQFEYGYKLWEAVSRIRFDAGPYPAEVFLDYVYNTAEGVPSDQNKAYNFSFKIGNEWKKGAYSLYYKYAYIEQNAVLGCLNDQDFYGANRKGHKVAVHFWPWSRVLPRAAFFYTGPITPWKTAAQGNPLWISDRYREHENRLQIDFVLKF